MLTKQPDSWKAKMLLVLFIILWLVLGCTPDAMEAQPLQSSIVYGLPQEPAGFDPHRFQSPEIGIVLRQVYDTLVYRDPETKAIVPGLASEWTISEDGLIYTFILRQGVSFHDGTPFNAEAVAANLDRITRPETLSQHAVFLLGPYANHEIVDPYTIRIVLSEPYAPLLDSLSQVYLAMASPTAFDQYSINRYQYHQVGTGPYRFVKYTPGQEIILQRNPDYSWGPAFYTERNQGSVDEIVYRFYLDASTRSDSLERGEVAVMSDLPPIDARALSGNSQVRLLPVDVPGQPLQFLMNVQRYPTDNVVVRQALLYATNRNVIVDTVFQGFSPVAWGPLSASAEFYNREVVGRYNYDLQQARALLTSSGFVDSDNNGYFDSGEGDLEVTLLIQPDEFLPQVVQLIEEQWRDAGIRVIVRQVPNLTALREEAALGEYNLVALHSFGYDPAFLNQYFMTGALNNYTGYSNPDLDRALTLAVREGASGVRRGIYNQIQHFIMDQALILPIQDYVNLNATSTQITNLQYDTYGWYPLMNNIIRTMP